MKFKKTTAALLVAGLTVAGSSYAWANEVIFKSHEDQKEITTDVSTTTIIDPSKNLEETTKDSETTSTDTKTIEDESTENIIKVAKEEQEKANEGNTVQNKDKETTENDFPEIPENYTAGNLVALKQAYNNAGSENAKQAILKNAKKAIARFEAKHGSKEEVKKSTEVQVEIELVGIRKPGETTFEPVKEVEQSKVETSTKTETIISTKEQYKADKKALKDQHKAEKKALKDQYKEEK